MISYSLELMALKTLPTELAVCSATGLSPVACSDTCSSSAMVCIKAPLDLIYVEWHGKNLSNAQTYLGHLSDDSSKL